MESWLSEHLSFEEREVIRVPGVGTIYHHEYRLILFIICFTISCYPFGCAKLEGTEKCLLLLSAMSDSPCLTIWQFGLV
jgi:hypothetical protein